MKTELTYSSAFSELEKLVTQIEDNRIPLDTLADKVKKANELIEFCETKLRAIQKEIEEASKITKASTRKKNSQ
jgi:exodeoxyribonuclease VII small subunit